MAITTRLCLTLAIALAVVGTFSHNVHAASAEAAPVRPRAEVVDDTFNYEQYQSPPIWTHAQPIDHNNVRIMNDLPHDDYIPIQYRPGGARGGDNGGHHGRRRRSFEKRAQHSNVKRAVIYHDDAHLDLLQNVEFDAVVSTEVNTDLPKIDFMKRAVVKRALVDDEGEVEAQEEDEEEEDNDTVLIDENPDEITEGDEEIGEIDGEYFSHIFEGHDADAEADFENDEEGEEEDEDEDEGEEGEYDEDEERRLDSEAGLQDWIEEMKSEEYFDLAGHPAGQDDEDVQNFDVDEPSPSEEEIFAASW
ncbi:hypothetical protein BGZ82_004671 [Podila clonocystis]|nr:hypothetical protein BGZ82_004671 [Podila clonocystis]